MESALDLGLNFWVFRDDMPYYITGARWKKQAAVYSIGTSFELCNGFPVIGLTVTPWIDAGMSPPKEATVYVY